MKLVIFIASIAVLTADCRDISDGAPEGRNSADEAHQQQNKAPVNVADGPQDRDSHEVHQQLRKAPLIMAGIPGPDLEEEKGQSESELRGSSCKPKIQCSILGGSCVAKGARCYGRRVPVGCRGSCECCIPGCSEEQEFFSPTGSKQCFKLFKDKTRNWEDANAKCREEGLVPPHPYDPVTLRAYIVTRFGYTDAGMSYVVWLNGRGNGEYITWQDNDTPIKADNPLWRPGFTYDGSSTQCFQLRADEVNWKEAPGQPYHHVPCDWGDFYFTLCEWNYGRVDM